MENELEELYKELNEVKACDLEYLPKYGYSSKEEIIQLIEEDIEELRAELECNQYDYTPDELEDERMFLCVIKGYQDIVKLKKNIYNEYNNDNPAA